MAIHHRNGNLKGEADVIASFGNIYQDLGKYVLALKHYQEAVAIRHRINDQHGEAIDNINIGNLYINLGQYQRALDYYQQALEIVREFKDRQHESVALNNMGFVYSKIGQFRIALKYYRQSLMIARQLKDSKDEGNTLLNIGQVYHYLTHYNWALDYYRRALAIAKKIKKIKSRENEGEALLQMGLTYNALKQYDRALTFLHDSLEIFQELEMSDFLWRTQRGIGTVQAKRKWFVHAIVAYEQAIDNLEKLRAGLEEKEHKLSFMRGRRYVYDELIALLQSLHTNHPNKHYDRKALKIFERKQGRVFLEEMGQSGARLFTGLPQKITQQEQAVAQQWVKTLTDLGQLRAQPFEQQDRVRIGLLAQQLATLEKAQAALETRIQTEYPKYYALKYPQPATLTTLQNQVLQVGEMMLVYGVMEENTVLWVIGKHQFQMLTLPLGEEEIKQQVDEFSTAVLEKHKELIEKAGQRGFTKKELVEEFESTAKETLPKVIKTSHRLYQHLLPVAARQLLGDAKLVYVIPTGPLYCLAFEALVTAPVKDEETPYYLIQDYAIAYLSSASLLKTLRDTQTRRKAPQPLLAFADPIYPACATPTIQTRGANTDNFISLRTRAYQKLMGGCFKRLPKTADEATAIANLFNAPLDKALKLREAATRETVFNTKLDEYRYIVFATHAVLPHETNGVTQSALVLTHQRPDENAYLTMADVFGLKLNADFVTLSACNTGRGEQIKSEGIRGLTRAFMYAGTPAVSVTLWQVESQSAKSLSTGTFQHLQRQNLADALRQTKLAMLSGKGEVYEYHPYFWAPFVIWGDGTGK